MAAATDRYRLGVIKEVPTMAPRTASRRKALGLALAPLLFAAFAAQAAAPRHKHSLPHGRAPANSENAVTYNRDSPNPDVGWHTDRSGMRVCTLDCDNPEISGSGFTCKDVKVLGMAMRECDR